MALGERQRRSALALVFGEERLGLALPGEDKIAQCGVGHGDQSGITQPQFRSRGRIRIAPAPGVAKPQRRQQVQGRGVGSAIGHRDADA